MKTSTKIILGTITGAAVGVAVGILLAPNRGNNTHKKTSDQSGQLKEDMSNKVQQSVDRMNALTTSAFQLINEYKQKLRKTQQENAPINDQHNT
jgi:gas vesicle protein